MWILPNDYQVTIRNEVKRIITGGDPDILAKAEAIAIDMARSQIAGRYDVAAIFIDIAQFTPGTQYNEGDYVYDSNQKIYHALINDPGDDLSLADNWERKDPRNRLLLSKVIDITLYELHSNISPGNIPQLRHDRYKEAINWLKEIALDKQMPDLPLLAIADGAPFSGSSRTQYSRGW